MNTQTHILASGFLAALLCCTGCVTSRVIEDVSAPEITVDAYGTITFNNERIELDRLVKTIKSAGITREQEVNVLVPNNFDRTLRDRIYVTLRRGGYTRTIFITKRKSSSFATGKPPERFQ